MSFLLWLNYVHMYVKLDIVIRFWWIIFILAIYRLNDFFAKANILYFGDSIFNFCHFSDIQKELSDTVIKLFILILSEYRYVRIFGLNIMYLNLIRFVVVFYGITILSDNSHLNFKIKDFLVVNLTHSYQYFKSLEVYYSVYW